MMIIYCNEPIAPRQVDSMFEEEAEAAQALDLGTALISYEELVAGNPQRATRTIREQNEPIQAIYRGWMLTPVQYSDLYHALVDKGVRLANTPEQYRHTHYLPESYGVIEAHTPRSVWLPSGQDVDFDTIMHLIAPFGDAPVVVKDYVKSQKHYWHEAFYIPSAADRTEVERVVTGFIELQGDSLNEGLVFREFVELAPLAHHHKSGIPLSREFRLFLLDGKLIVSAPYWDEVDDDIAEVPIDTFVGVAQRVNSNFFTMDVALRANGDWMIVELGDGQVAGLPDHVDVSAFYQKLGEV